MDTMDSQIHDLPPAYSRPVPLLHTRLAPLAHSVTYPQSAPPSRIRFLPEDGLECNPVQDHIDAPPPSYSAFDESLCCFALRAPLIYTLASGSIRPRYQLSQEHSRSGIQYRLRIRRLLPTESRRLSIPTPGRPCKIDFDEDTTLYLIENLGAFSVFKGQRIEIRGRKAKTLPGHITLNEEDGKWEFWHLTRNPAGDSLKKENERKMQKYGYRSDDEWNKNLLFRADACPRDGKVDWRDADGKTIATEIDGKFDIATHVDQKTKDALVTCFVARRWATRSLIWDTQEGLSRAVSR
jgi:hypothetical protein